MTAVNSSDTEIHWFAMRDLKRANAQWPAYKMLAGMGFEVYTPMKDKVTVKNGKRIRESVPFMPDLLFVRGARKDLDPVVNGTDTLQYRFMRNGYCKPMIVRDEEMTRFITAVSNTESVRFYHPDEIKPEMVGRRIRIIGGPLSELEGTLITMRGSKTKRLLVEIPDFLTAGVEVQPEYIKILS